MPPLSYNWLKEGNKMDAMEGQHRRGILHATMGDQKFSLRRYQPAAELHSFVKHYWVVQWDLRGQAPYCQTVVSHPNVNLVFEPNTTRVYGVAPTTTDRLVEGHGFVVGVKFQPGGFYPFWQRPVSGLTGRSLSFQEVFDLDVAELEQDVLSQTEVGQSVGVVDAFFQSRLPESDPNVELVNEIVRLIQEDRAILKVEQVARQVGLHIRTMQRLLDRYVGVSPKWIIKRYRLHDAVESMEQGTVPDWSQLSVELGYYDQSHFIRDFKAIIGRSPEEYVRERNV